VASQQVVRTSSASPDAPELQRVRSEARYVVECEWSGYHSGQQHICHRAVEPYYRAKKLESVRAIVFTDGTTMSVAVRPCAPRERVKQMIGYREVLDDARTYGLTGFVTIEAISAARAAAKGSVRS
jgi:hypothetical protein